MLKSAPTIAEHMEFGRAIKRFRFALGQFATGKESALGTWRFNATSRQTKALAKVTKALDALKCILDDDVCAALPMSDHRTTRIYYGPEDPPELESDHSIPVPPAPPYGPRSAAE